MLIWKLVFMLLLFLFSGPLCRPCTKWVRRRDQRTTSKAAWPTLGSVTMKKGSSRTGLVSTNGTPWTTWSPEDRPLRTRSARNRVNARKRSASSGPRWRRSWCLSISTRSRASTYEVGSRRTWTWTWGVQTVHRPGDVDHFRTDGRAHGDFRSCLFGVGVERFELWGITKEWVSNSYSYLKYNF